MRNGTRGRSPRFFFICVTEGGRNCFLKKMFLVVEFSVSKTVNIIPATWFADGVTWWPSYKTDDRINRAVQKCEDPGTDWKRFDVRVLSRAGDYLRAREKLKISLTCNTSEIQTDDEEEIKRKRRVKPRVIFGDTDSESDDQEPQGAKKRRGYSVTPLPPIPPPNVNLERHGDQRHDGSSWFADAPLAPMTTGPPSPLRHSHSHYTIAPVATPYRSSINQVSCSDEHWFNPTVRLGRAGTGPIPCSAAELHILTLLEHVREQQLQLATAVNNLAARVGTDSRVSEMPPDINLPLATGSEVEDLEQWLNDSANARAKQNMISALGAVGGETTKKIVWNVLSRLFSDAVARTINWKGVNGKRAFKDMQTRTLLIRAVRKNAAATSTSDTEINALAIRWFNLATDRGGGRRDRERARGRSTLSDIPPGN